MRPAPSAANGGVTSAQTRRSPARSSPTCAAPSTDAGEWDRAIEIERARQMWSLARNPKES